MRGAVKKRNKPESDRKYNSVEISRFINHVMLDGKKEKARQSVYEALEIAGKKLNSEPKEVFETAIKNIGPNLEVRSRRVGGANYQVPREVRPERKSFLAMTWIIDIARGKKGKPFAQRLAEEFISAYNNEGEAVKKRENMHKMAEANKAFAHFAM